MNGRGRGNCLEAGNVCVPAVGGGLGIFRAGDDEDIAVVLEFLIMPLSGAPRLATRGLCSVARSAEVDRRPSPSVAGEARPCGWISAVDCETTAGAALTVRGRCGGGGGPREGVDASAWGDFEREGRGGCGCGCGCEGEGESFGTALCTRERGGGGAA